MRYRSKSNSRHWENLALRARYREDNPYCEAYPLMCRRARHDGMHIHHIAHQGVRCDRTGNLIHLCAAAHGWVHAHPVDGTVLCLRRKLAKQELSADDWKCGSIKPLSGWLWSAGDRVTVARREWLELMDAMDG